MFLSSTLRSPLSDSSAQLGLLDSYCKGKIAKKAMCLPLVLGKKIQSWRNAGFVVFYYFNNTKHGYAISDAKLLKTMLRHN